MDNFHALITFAFFELTYDEYIVNKTMPNLSIMHLDYFLSKQEVIELFY
jgi:hypothetical protein